MLSTGHSRTLGAHVEAGGVNFALAAPNADAVELCLFAADGAERRLPLPAKSQGIWHGFLPGATVGQLYGWRVHGPWNPAEGHRFNPAKLLLDPYAREVVGTYGGEDMHWGHCPSDPSQPDPRDNAAQALKARVVEEWPTAQRCAAIDPARRVIYEVHVKGFTATHPEVPDDLRGTFAGLSHPAAIAHFQRLGVTTLCIMPVAHRADEERLLKMGLRNYWGYSPVAWNAPEGRYWSGRPGTTPRSEFRQMVAALHAAGLEVILDVVYNHTAETDELGPTLSFRGIDNATYYHLDSQQKQYYLNVTGCGNTFNLQNPLGLRTVMDSLRTWVHDAGVDGFRFDLAPVLGRAGADRAHAFASDAPFLMAVAQDPVLRDLLMVAEPWDIGLGGYQLGRFPDGWLEWNDRFRDAQRAFWLRGQGDLGALATRLAGSTDIFEPGFRAPTSSINFVTAHDGFTMTDLVSYNQRHNLANGENNRDGHAENWSDNHGVEGPTDDVGIGARRLRKKRALLASTLLSLGTPMLLAGDEIGHTQRGNNNAYCQDNAATWLNWSQADRALQSFVARLIEIRHQRRSFQAISWWAAPGSPAQNTVPGHAGVTGTWLRPDGSAMASGDWHDPNGKALALHLASALPGSASAIPDGLLLINASSETLVFSLPPGHWVCHADTHDGRCTDLPLVSPVQVPAGSIRVASTGMLDNSTLSNS